jgi:GDP-L-fucose synthase
LVEIDFPERVLVAGATGFIGRNIVERLATDPRCSVTGVWNNRPPYECPGITWVKADLTRQEDVDRIVPGFDAIVQMAATTSGSKDIVNAPHLHIVDNVVMNSLLLRAAHDRDIKKLVFPSCSIIYPSRDKPHDETSLDPTIELHDRYFGSGWNKLYLERMCQFYAGLGRTQFSVIRHTNIYGPHDKFDLDKSHVFGATVTKTMMAEDKVSVWGNGREARDLLYVGDLVDLVIAMLERQKQPYDMVCAGAGHAVTIRDLVDRIITASGKNLRVEHDLSKPTIATTISLSHAKAKREYDWSPQIDLDAGIRLTLDWWSKHVGRRIETSKRAHQSD